MNVFIKTLAGDLFSVTCPPHTTAQDLPFLVYPILRHQAGWENTPIHHLRLVPEQTKEVWSIIEGQLFYLFVEDPQIQVRIYFEDHAVQMVDDETMDPLEDEDEAWIQRYERESQTMEVYLLRVLHRQDEILFQHLFYTTVAHVGPVGQTVKRYSNVYYHEDDMEVVYNPSIETRIHHDPAPYGAGNYRDVELHPGATAHYRPSVFAEHSPVSAYMNAIREEIDRVWLEHVKRTGEPMLYPIQRLYSRGGDDV